MTERKPWHNHKEGGWNSAAIFREAGEFRYLETLKQEMAQAVAAWAGAGARENPLREKDFSDLVEEITANRSMDERQKNLFQGQLFFLRDTIAKNLNRQLAEEENELLETKLNEKFYGK